MGLDPERGAGVGHRPDGWGPFDSISAFARIEVRYDCVWTGCGLSNPGALRQPRHARAGGQLGGRSSPSASRGRSTCPLGIPVRADPARSTSSQNITSRAARQRGIEAGVPQSTLEAAFGPLIDDVFTYKRIDAYGVNGVGDTLALPLGPWRPESHIARTARSPSSPSHVDGPADPPGHASSYVPRRSLRRAARRLRLLRPELPPDRARVEPRREPGREGAEGGLRRRRDVRQPALAARRQADDRLGQDRALPQPGPVQPAGRRRSPRCRASRSRASRSGRSRGDLVVLRRRAAQRRAPRARDELRRVRADRPRALRRALHAVWRSAASPPGSGRHGSPASASPARSARPIPGTTRRPRVRRAPRVPLGPLQLRDHRLLRLRGLPVRRRSSSYSRNVDPRTGRPLDTYGRPLERTRRSSDSSGNRQLFESACEASLGFGASAAAALTGGDGRDSRPRDGLPARAHEHPGAVRDRGELAGIRSPDRGHLPKRDGAAWPDSPAATSCSTAA